MARSNLTKIEPQTEGNFSVGFCEESATTDNQGSVPTQRPSPLNGVSLPRPPKGNRYAEKHGLNTLKTAIFKLGNRAIDGRFHVGRELKKWRRELVADLGGEDSVSTQQNALIDLAVKSKLLLDSIDAWLLTQPSLINKQKKSVYPVVLQRQQLADGLARYLKDLGLQRRHKVKTLNEILAQPDDTPANSNGAANGEQAND
jgi:hypothetical protein